MLALPHHRDLGVRGARLRGRGDARSRRADARAARRARPKGEMLGVLGDALDDGVAAAARGRRARARSRARVARACAGGGGVARARGARARARARARALVTRGDARERAAARRDEGAARAAKRVAAIAMLAYLAEDACDAARADGGAARGGCDGAALARARRARRRARARAVARARARAAARRRAYETTWGGVCTTRGLDDPAADFGNGWCDDEPRASRRERATARATRASL